MTLAADIAHSRHKNWKSLAADALAGTGVHASRPVHANLTAPALVAEARTRDMRAVCRSMARWWWRPACTPAARRRTSSWWTSRRSPVTIWWGKVNNRLAPEKFAVLKARVQAYLQGPGAVHPGPVCRRRSGASRAGAAGQHRRVADVVCAQHIHPSEARGTGRLPARLRHPARAALPDRSGDRRRAQRHRRSRCRSNSGSSSSPAPSMRARSRSRSSP